MNDPISSLWRAREASVCESSMGAIRLVVGGLVQIAIIC